MSYETVDALLDDICEAVREKENSEGLVDHVAVPSRIRGIKTAPGGNATGSDMREGTHAWVNGERVDGTLPVSTGITFDNSLVRITKGTQHYFFEAQNDREKIYSEGANFQFELTKSSFGNAKPENVDFGVTFTSQEGLSLTGKRPVDEGNVSGVTGAAEADTLSGLHYWEKVAEGDDILEEKVVDYRLSYSNSSLDIVIYGFTHYADEIAVVDGALALVNPVARGSINEETLRGKYIQNNSDFYRIPADVTITTTQSTGATSYIQKDADRVFKLTCVASGKVTYVVSNDITTFPENGEQDGYSYTYKGTLNDTGSEAVIAALTITENGIYTAPAGVDGYSPITVNVTPEDIPAVEQATPVIEVSTSGLITATATQDGGQVVAGTKSATKQLSTQAAKSYTPGASDQVIPSGTYLTGAQTIKGEPNLLPENIPVGVTLFNVAGTREMSTTDLSDIGKLHFWEKYRVDPTINYEEKEKENVSLLVYRYYVGSTTNYYIYYGDTFTFDEETKQFSLTSEGYCNTLDAAQANIPGKYISYNNYNGYIYFVPEDAVITQTTSSTVGTARSIVISKATQLLANNPLCYVGSEASGTYPENGEHSDGYWYVYRGLLADAISQ